MTTHPATAHPREEVAQRNLEAILDAAERLLRRQAEPTISAVAKEAGLSRPTVYAHFPDRAQLLQAVVERAVRGAMSAIQSADPGHGPADVALSRVIAASWEQIALHQSIAHAATAQLGGEAMRQAHASAREFLVGLFERGQAEGAVRADLPADWLASASLALMHAAAEEVRAGELASGAAAGVLDRTIAGLVAGSG